MRYHLAAGLLAVLASPAAAQNAARPSCNTPEHRQFDFWVGDWIVENPANGAQAGVNVVTRDFNGCVITEQWTSGVGNRGSSYNVYDRRRGVWHQTWVDDSGSLLLLEGRFDGTSMVLLSPELTLPNGSRRINRMTWTPLEGGRVRQQMEASTDGGATWTTGFVGIYRPRS
jgi:hypothetical protein